MENKTIYRYDFIQRIMGAISISAEKEPTKEEVKAAILEGDFELGNIIYEDIKLTSKLTPEKKEKILKEYQKNILKEENMFLSIDKID